MSEMATAKEFLTDFLKDIVKNPGDRPTVLEGYIRLLELRELAIRAGEV